MKTIVIDVETCPNYSFIGVYLPEHNIFQRILYTKENAAQLISSFFEYEKIIFFNIRFDLSHLIICSKTPINPHLVSKALIEDNNVKSLISDNDLTPEEDGFLTYALYRQELLHKKFIDVQPLAAIATMQENGMLMPHKRSLKYFSAIFLHRIINECADLFDKEDLTESEKQRLIEYNKIDLLTTYEIFKKVEHIYEAQSSMGRVFNLNCTTKTNSGLIVPLLKRLMGVDSLPVHTPITGAYYDDRYKTEPSLQLYLSVYDKIQKGWFNSTSVVLPFIPKMNLTIGLGGLHAISDKILYPNRIQEGWMLIDFDIVSQYPSIYIQTDGIFSPKIQQILQNMMGERKRLKKAKGCKDTIAAYKIILNGAYGRLKLDTQANSMYNPIGMYRTAIGGQLQIIFAVLELYKEGWDVVYVNTDGFTILAKKDTDIEALEKRVLELVNRFYKNIEIETKIYRDGIFFNVNSYVMIDNTETLKAKNEFRHTSPLLTLPRFISRELLNKTGIITHEKGYIISDFIFIRTSKNGFDNGNKIAICYYCEEETQFKLNGHSVGFVNDIKEIRGKDIKIEAYLQEVEAMLEEDRHQHFSKIELDIMEENKAYYVPVKKNNEPYANFENKIYFGDPLLHNKYVVLNRPTAKCSYKLFN